MKKWEEPILTELNVNLTADGVGTLPDGGVG